MKRGYTLLESIIAVGLLGLVGLSFAYLYITAQRFTIQSVDFTSNQNDAAFALEHVKRHLTVATTVTTPTTGGPATTSLEFKWQPRVDLPERTSRYEVNGTDLRFIPDIASVGVFDVVSQGITNITFNRATAGTVSVNVTAQRTPGAEGDTRKMRLQTNVSPRGLF